MDFTPIRKGSLLVSHNWLDAPLVAALRENVYDLQRRGEFIASGVATAGVDGAYGRSDRRVHVLSSEEWTRSDARQIVYSSLKQLCAQMRTSLDRPTLHIGAEQYFSISSSGASLSHHMDERHEETKGFRGWETATRRSVSWLLYLNVPTWNKPVGGGAGAGGEFLAHCRRNVRLATPHCSCGAHDDCLQVGWLTDASRDSDEPVYLDSWLRIPADANDEWKYRAASSLFVVDEQQERGRRYLTSGFSSNSPSWRAVVDTDDDDDDDDEEEEAEGGGMSPRAFGAALRAQLPTEALRAAFSSVEDVPHPRSDAIKVAPLGGTLLLFDSVAVPHSVLPTIEGDRLALAGWFHEDQQEFPEWYGT